MYYMPTDVVDETAANTGMMSGGATVANQTAGRPSLISSPTKSLLALWFVVLAVYWFVGWFFKGGRA